MCIDTVLLFQNLNEKITLKFKIIFIRKIYQNKFFFMNYFISKYFFNTRFFLRANMFYIMNFMLF